MPLETAKSFNDEDYDSVVIIGNKLEEDLEKSKLTDYLEALKPIKNVNIDINIRVSSLLTNL